MCKLYKYVIIKDGVLCVLETDRMKEVIRNELGVFDYRDYIFDDDSSVLKSFYDSSQCPCEEDAYEFHVCLCYIL